MSEAVPAALRGGVRARRVGWRVRLAPALTEMVADCAGMVGFVWALLAPMVGVVWICASVYDKGRLLLEATVALPVLQAVGALLIGVPVAVTLNLSGSLRWLELRPLATPTRIVLRLWCRRHVVPVAELTEVVVRERRRHGRLARIDVDLVTGGRTETCRGGELSPLRRVDSRALAGWLSELLSPAGVPVRHEFVVVEQRIVRQWWPAKRVAAAWNVQVDQVPELAARWEIRTADRSGTPVYRSLDVEQRAVQVKSL
ncbi:hypothetical protein [Actinophytocola sp.]|uniref:hypothetical protein n=1 Tax=Actinophytocola sp. TaxID=1872138 RepID=UPI002ED3CDD3